MLYCIYFLKHSCAQRASKGKSNERHQGCSFHARAVCFVIMDTNSRIQVHAVDCFCPFLRDKDKLPHIKGDLIINIRL